MTESDWREAVVAALDELVESVPWGEESDGYMSSPPRSLRDRIAKLREGMSE